MVINARVLPDVRFNFVDICFVIVIRVVIHVVFIIQLADYM